VTGLLMEGVITTDRLNSTLRTLTGTIFAQEDYKLDLPEQGMTE